MDGSPIVRGLCARTEEVKGKSPKVENPKSESEPKRRREVRKALWPNEANRDGPQVQGRPGPSIGGGVRRRVAKWPNEANSAQGFGRE